MSYAPPPQAIKLCLLAGLIAMLLCLGGVRASAPRVDAATTSVAVVGCEFIAGSANGVPHSPTAADLNAACGYGAGATSVLPPVCGPVGTCDSLQNLAEAIGNEDGILTKSDFADIEGLDRGNQLSTDCTGANLGNKFGVGPVGDFVDGLACTLDVFVFVDQEGPVTLNLPAGLASLESPLTSTFTCTTEPRIPYAGLATITAVNAVGVFTMSAVHGLAVGDQITVSAIAAAVPAITPGTSYTIATVPTATTFTTTPAVALTTPGTSGSILTLTPLANAGLGFDNDCSGGPPTGFINNGDGVAMFHIVEGNASVGTVETIGVSQDAVEQTFEVNVVGTPSGVDLALGKNVIETNGNQTNAITCAGTTSFANALAPPTSTIALATVTDQFDEPLTRVPVLFTLAFSPPGGDPARLGDGSLLQGFVGTTQFSIGPALMSYPIAAYAVVCGGTGTGPATIDASIHLRSCGLTSCIFGAPDHFTQSFVTSGAPNGMTLAATPPSIACDGSNTSTLTAHITDDLGQDVANGVPVNFNVTGPGSANPINTVTAGGLASSTIKPLPAGGGGVAIVVTAGDAAIAVPIQASAQVLCAASPTPTAIPTATPCAGDADCDGVPDAIDNCPSVPNPDQANTNLFNYTLNRPGSDPRGDVCDPDISGDGYGNVKKYALGKNLLVYCPILRADVDGDGVVSILDLTKVAKFFGETVPPAPQRYMQDADASISILDLTKMAQVFAQHASACP